MKNKKLKISIIITSFREEASTRKAIMRFLPQIHKEDEILVAAPDKATENMCAEFKGKGIRYIKDPGWVWILIWVGLFYLGISSVMDVWKEKRIEKRIGELK